MRRCLLTFALSVLSAVTSSGCGRSQTPDAPSRVVSVAVEQQSSWVRNFNPLLPPQISRWPTRSGIYEPMFIYNTAKHVWLPWLALERSWSADLTTLRFSLRPDVKWSDGQPFSAKDVAYTFELMRRFPALDVNHAWGYLSSVEVEGALAVVFHLKRPHVPGFDDLAHQPIVPEHVWKEIADPLTFSNPSPVATGPFTEVRAFRNQLYELGKNPHYWQAGKPKVDALRFLAYPTNDQASLALIEGSVDWAGTFLPAIKRTYVRRDPEHFHYWFPLLGTMVFMYANHARPPFDDVRVRKAMSMALDRNQLVEIASYGYTRPAEGSGLTDAFLEWRVNASEHADWVTYNVKAANRLLDQAGCPRADGGLRRCGGRPMSFDIEVVSGWSDWLRAAQLISRQLQQVGIVANLRVHEFSAWFDHVQKGQFDLAIAWSLEGPSPYRFYRWLMSRDTLAPVGTISQGNWHRFASSEADALLTRFERTADVSEQKAIMTDLQRVFAQVAPAIPLFPNPLWGEFNTRRVTGFPSEANPYALLSPNREPDPLLVMIELMPRSR